MNKQNHRPIAILITAAVFLVSLVAARSSAQQIDFKYKPAPVDNPLKGLVPETPLFQVDFEFGVAARLNVTNDNTLGNFEALFNADFLNTATLESVTVFDDAGEVIPGASLVDSVSGQSIVAATVPEPSAAIFLLLAGCAGSIRRRRVA